MPVPSRSDPLWGPVPLPEQFKEIRDQQWEGIERAVDSYLSGDDVVYLEGPTGSGKSFIAEGARRLLSTKLKVPIRANMVTTTKALQRQYQEAFPYGRVVMGKSNYWTQSGALDELGNRILRNPKWSSITCADCTSDGPGDDCRWCPETSFCPYTVAKLHARNAELAILNTSYFLADAKYVGNFADRELTVLDEADLIEGELLSMIEVVISNRRLTSLGIGPPKRKTPGEDGKGCVEWASWIRNVALPALDVYLGKIPKPWDPGTSPSEAREFRGAKELKGKLLSIVADVALGGWIYDGYEQGHVIFRPVRVEKYGSNLLWPASKRFLVMSATILSADLMNDELGGYLPYSSIVLPSVFPAANRPIYVCPVANMSMKETKATDGRNRFEMMLGVMAMLNKRPDDRVLVHTVSYDLARYLYEELQHLNRPMVIYTDSGGKEDALREYKRERGSVLLAASMDRGIDLPDEMCRVMGVAKIPFLSLGDKRVNARLFTPGGQNWYRKHAVATLIQQTGRGVRHKDDKAETFILDRDFLDNLWKADWLFPQYWRDAIDWRKDERWLMG